jgi:hypothetical protein
MPIETAAQRSSAAVFVQSEPSQSRISLHRDAGNKSPYAGRMDFLVPADTVWGEWLSRL